MKRLLLPFLLVALAVAFGITANGQGGLFPANTVWGNNTGLPAQPKVIPASSLAAGIAVGGPITGGTNLQVLYDNNHIIGEYTNAQLTTLMNLATSALSGALPAWPNNTTTYFRGDGTYQTLNCAALTNGSPSCSTDTTNATNITTGTLGAGRLPAFGSGDVSFATGGGAGTIAANAVTNAKAAQATANTVKGNFTSGTANVADNAMPSCSDTGGHHLNYVSGTGVTCGTTASGTALVLLNTLTASSSASLGDTTSLTNTYSSYLIILDNILPDTAATTLELQVHSGGSYQGSSYLCQTYNWINGGTGVISSTSYIALTSSSLINSGAGVSGELRIYNPAQTASPKQVTGTVSAVISASGPGGSIVNGYWNGGNGAIDGLQFIFSAGNITSGTIRIYGVL